MEGKEKGEGERGNTARTRPRGEEGDKVIDEGERGQHGEMESKAARVWR